MFDLAPALVGGPQTRHRPRLLAFVRAWTIDDGAEVAHLRKRLTELDAELVIVNDDGVYSLSRDCEPLRCAVDANAAREVYSVTADAVFVIDHRGHIRFTHAPDRPLSATLVEALDAASEALAWREHQTKLERIQWTPREWSLKCLVVGCSLTFLAGPPTIETRRLARGTGPISRYDARDVITPGADEGAPAPQMCEVGEFPTMPSLRRMD